MPSRRPSRKNPGFALVVTLSLMILLTIIAVGLLTLSGVSLRSASQTGAMASARANARMGLMLALGELQRQTGPDTRVTARADILDESNPPVFGAWKSWEGTNHETKGNFAGRPVSPGNYKSRKQERFLAWLVSGEQTQAVPNTGKGTNKATLVGPGSVGSGGDRDKLQVHLLPSEITGSAQRGAIAWWVGGENTKARLPKPYQPESDAPGRWAVHMKSHAVADPGRFRMESLLDDASPAARAITLGQADLIATKSESNASREFFHDLSTHSVGLLTNTATGGWRKDLSLLTENWNAQPSLNLPLFRLVPEQDITFSRPTSSPVSPKSMLYPWAAYRSGNIPIYQHGPVTSWQNLADYATLYRTTVSSSASGRATAQSRSHAIDNTATAIDFLHKVRLLPVIARMQWVFSHWAAPAGSTTGGGAATLEPRLLLTPVITMWNPYSVELASPPNLRFNVARPLPAALRYTVDAKQNPGYSSVMGGANNNQPALATSSSLPYEIQSAFVLKPGETRVFSPASTTPIAAGQTIVLQPGFRQRGGHFFPVIDAATGRAFTGTTSTTIRADAKFDTTYNDHASARVSTGVGIYLDMSVGGVRHLVYRMVYEEAIANMIYKPLTNLASTTLGQAQGNPVPFLSTIFGARMASNTHIPAKGFLQSSPLVNYTAMGRKDEEEANIARHYGGTGHPVNSPFDYSFVKHAQGDSYLPNADASNRGYIVTGFQSSNGLSRCVVSEIPTRPIQSLAELQNWDLRYENPIPPFAINLIGNSNATPLLPPDAVVNSADANLSVNLQHDDSYCANHLLFDDWFFSSIAPDPTSFGTSGRNLQQTFTGFVSGTAPLPNRAYQPIGEDLGTASANPSAASQLFNRHVKPSDSWKSIASRIEVEGMFNVNSTSVAAWRALLGHARDQKVPFVRESGASWNVDTSDESDHAVSRFSVAGDAQAGTKGSSGQFSAATEFAGYRVLDEKILDAFAVEIVRQVRARGPFLSLAEFVNRQLSSGDLALAGAIQAALDSLDKSPSTSPYAGINSYLSANLVRDALAQPEMAARAEYRFPDAAAGKSAFGLPGWTRQADVLRPLAPILSARDDTFTIRAYGDARDSNGKITASAVCEAVVKRTRGFVDPADTAESFSAPKSSVNKTFGRRYQILTFRWLAPGEV